MHSTFFNSIKPIVFSPLSTAEQNRKEKEEEPSETLADKLHADQWHLFLLLQKLKKIDPDGNSLIKKSSLELPEKSKFFIRQLLESDTLLCFPKEELPEGKVVFKLKKLWEYVTGNFNGGSLLGIGSWFRLILGYDFFLKQLLGKEDKEVSEEHIAFFQRVVGPLFAILPEDCDFRYKLTKDRTVRKVREVSNNILTFIGTALKDEPPFFYETINRSFLTRIIIPSPSVLAINTLLVKIAAQIPALPEICTCDLAVTAFLERDNLLTMDSLQCKDINQKNPSLIAADNDLMRAMSDFSTQRVHVIDPHTLNDQGWRSYLKKRAVGGWTLQQEVEAILAARLDKIAHKRVVDKQGKVQDYLPLWFAGAFPKYKQLPLAAAAAFLFQSCLYLEGAGYFEAQRKMRNLSLSIDKASSSRSQAIYQLLTSSLPFSTVVQFLQIAAFFHLFTGKARYFGYEKEITRLQVEEGYYHLPSASAEQIEVFLKEFPREKKFRKLLSNAFYTLFPLEELQQACKNSREFSHLIVPSAPVPSTQLLLANLLPLFLYHIPFASVTLYFLLLPIKESPESFLPFLYSIARLQDQEATAGLKKLLELYFPKEQLLLKKELGKKKWFERLVNDNRVSRALLKELVKAWNDGVAFPCTEKLMGKLLSNRIINGAATLLLRSRSCEKEEYVKKWPSLLFVFTDACFASRKMESTAKYLVLLEKVSAALKQHIQNEEGGYSVAQPSEEILQSLVHLYAVFLEEREAVILFFLDDLFKNCGRYLPRLFQEAFTATSLLASPSKEHIQQLCKLWCWIKPPVISFTRSVEEGLAARKELFSTLVKMIQAFEMDQEKEVLSFFYWIASQSGPSDLSNMSRLYLFIAKKFSLIERKGLSDEQLDLWIKPLVDYFIPAGFNPEEKNSWGAIAALLLDKSQDRKEYPLLFQGFYKGYIYCRYTISCLFSGQKWLSAFDAFQRLLANPKTDYETKKEGFNFFLSNIKEKVPPLSNKEIEKLLELVDSRFFFEFYSKINFLFVVNEVVEGLTDKQKGCEKIAAALYLCIEKAFASAFPLHLEGESAEKIAGYLAAPADFIAKKEELVQTNKIVENVAPLLKRIRGYGIALTLAFKADLSALTEETYAILQELFEGYCSKLLKEGTTGLPLVYLSSFWQRQRDEKRKSIFFFSLLSAAASQGYQQLAILLKQGPIVPLETDQFIALFETAITNAELLQELSLQMDKLLPPFEENAPRQIVELFIKIASLSAKNNGLPANIKKIIFRDILLLLKKNQNFGTEEKQLFLLILKDLYRFKIDSNLLALLNELSWQIKGLFSGHPPPSLAQYLCCIKFFCDNGSALEWPEYIWDNWLAIGSERLSPAQKSCFLPLLKTAQEKRVLRPSDSPLMEKVISKDSWEALYQLAKEIAIPFQETKFWHTLLKDAIDQLPQSFAPCLDILSQLSPHLELEAVWISFIEKVGFDKTNKFLLEKVCLAALSSMKNIFKQEQLLLICCQKLKNCSDNEWTEWLLAHLNVPSFVKDKTTVARHLLECAYIQITEKEPFKRGEAALIALRKKYPLPLHINNEALFIKYCIESSDPLTVAYSVQLVKGAKMSVEVLVELFKAALKAFETKNKDDALQRMCCRVVVYFITILSKEYALKPIQKKEVVSCLSNCSDKFIQDHTLLFWEKPVNRLRAEEIVSIIETVDGMEKNNGYYEVIFPLMRKMDRLFYDTRSYIDEGRWKKTRVTLYQLQMGKIVNAAKVPEAEKQLTLFRDHENKSVTRKLYSEYGLWVLHIRKKYNVSWNIKNKFNFEAMILFIVRTAQKNVIQECLFCLNSFSQLMVQEPFMGIIYQTKLSENFLKFICEIDRLIIIEEATLLPYKELIKKCGEFLKKQPVVNLFFLKNHYSMVLKLISSSILIEINKGIVLDEMVMSHVLNTLAELNYFQYGALLETILLGKNIPSILLGPFIHVALDSLRKIRADLYIKPLYFSEVCLFALFNDSFLSVNGYVDAVAKELQLLNPCFPQPIQYALALYLRLDTSESGYDNETKKEGALKLLTLLIDSNHPPYLDRAIAIHCQVKELFKMDRKSWYAFALNIFSKTIACRRFPLDTNFISEIIKSVPLNEEGSSDCLELLNFCLQLLEKMQYNVGINVSSYNHERSFVTNVNTILIFILDYLKKGVKLALTDEEAEKKGNSLLFYMILLSNEVLKNSFFTSCLNEWENVEFALPLPLECRHSAAMIEIIWRLGKKRTLIEVYLLNIKNLFSSSHLAQLEDFSYALSSADTRVLNGIERDNNTKGCDN